MDKYNLLESVKENLNGDIPRYEDSIYESKINLALLKIAKRRNVAVADLSDKFFYDVVDLASYYIVLKGGDFQTSHSEGGISRVFRTEKEVLNEIIPVCKFY